MKAVSIVVFLAGCGVALSLANCSQSACSSSPASAGSSGSGGGSDCSTSASSGSGGAATTCGELTAQQACLDAFCAADGIGTPFCGCYAHGFNLKGATSDATSCTCIAINAESICEQATLNGFDGSEVDCTLLTSPLLSMCVGVQ
jgi:hypothetical protein